MSGMQESPKVVDHDIAPWEQEHGDPMLCLPEDPVTFSLDQLDDFLPDVDVDSDPLLDETFFPPSSVQETLENSMPSSYGCQGMQLANSSQETGLNTTAMALGDASPYSWPSIPDPMMNKLSSTARERVRPLLTAPDQLPVPSIPWLTGDGLNIRQSSGDVSEAPTDSSYSESLKRKQSSLGIVENPELGPGVTDAAMPTVNPYSSTNDYSNTFKLVMAEHSDSQERTTTMPSKEQDHFVDRKWRPPLAQTRSKSEDVHYLPHRPSREHSWPSLGSDEPQRPHTAFPCVPAARPVQEEIMDLRSSNEVYAHQVFKRPRITYRVRSNTLICPRSLSEPPPDTPARETNSGSVTKGKSCGGGQSSDVGLSRPQKDTSTAPNAPVSLGPDQVIVNATKMASFLDQLQTIQAKMQILQLQKANTKLQFATVQKAASLLEQTVAELNSEELQQETQMQLQEKSEEIRILLSSLSPHSSSQELPRTSAAAVQASSDKCCKSSTESGSI